MLKKLFLLAIFSPAVFGFSSLKLTLKPGVNIFSDGAGFGTGLGVYYNFVPPIRSGIELTFSYLPAPNLSFVSFGGGLYTGYGFSVFGKVAVSPGVTFGTEYIQFLDSYSNVGRFGFLIMPAVNAEYPLTGNFSLGIDVSYRVLLVNLPVFLYNLSSFNAAVSVSFAWDPAAKPTEEQSLASDIKTIMKGSSVNATVGTAKNEVQMNLSDVLFESGSDRIGSNSVRLISDIAAKARDYPGMTLLIEGHTDDNGTREANAALSLNRAKNVAAIFTAAGIADTRITVKGYGPDRPIVPNTSDQNRAKNRRVEIKFQFGKN